MPYEIEYETDELPLNVLVDTVKRHRRIVLTGALVGGAALFLASALEHHTFTSGGAFITQTSSKQAGGLSSLAAQFGMSVPSGDAAQSPSFYVYLVKSREVLAEAALAKYTVSDGNTKRTGTLLELYDKKGATPAETQQLSVRELSDLVGATSDKETGVIRFSVSTRWPELSAAIAQKLLDEMQAFNLRTRQSSARAERQFIERRMDTASADLRAAEERLQEFRRTNREFVLGSEATIERDRLMREISVRQQSYMTLADSYERAKIDEVRDTPAITVVETPVAAARADSRGIGRNAAIGLIGGFMLALLGCVLYDRSRRRAGTSLADPAARTA